MAANLNAVDEELKRLQAQRKELEPVPITLPDSLPELYRRYVAGLVATLSSEEVIGRAGDEIHRLIERIEVEHDEEFGHTVEIFRELAAMMGGADSETPRAMKLRRVR